MKSQSSGIVLREVGRASRSKILLQRGQLQLKHPALRRKGGGGVGRRRRGGSSRGIEAFQCVSLHLSHRGGTVHLPTSIHILRRQVQVLNPESGQKNSESSTCKRVPVPRYTQAWPWLPGPSWLLKSSGKGGAEEAWDLGKLTAEESARPSPGVRPDCAGHYPGS